MNDMIQCSPFTHKVVGPDGSVFLVLDYDHFVLLHIEKRVGGQFSPFVKYTQNKFKNIV